MPPLGRHEAWQTSHCRVSVAPLPPSASRGCNCRLSERGKKSLRSFGGSTAGTILASSFPRDQLRRHPCRETRRAARSSDSRRFAVSLAQAPSARPCLIWSPTNPVRLRERHDGLAIAPALASRASAMRMLAMSIRRPSSETAPRPAFAASDMAFKMR
jgi:hypothetical protein